MSGGHRRIETLTIGCMGNAPPLILSRIRPSVCDCHTDAQRLVQVFCEVQVNSGTDGVAPSGKRGVTTRPGKKIASSTRSVVEQTTSSTSSRRRPGPITTGGCLAKDNNLCAPSRDSAVWVPAFARPSPGRPRCKWCRPAMVWPVGQISFGFSDVNIFALSSLCAKNILLSYFRKSCFTLPHPAPTRGAYASSRTWCGMRWTWRGRLTIGSDTDGEIAWSWRPKGLALCRQCSRIAADGGNRQGSPGRARHKP
jgi:hypothetical protein